MLGLKNIPKFRLFTIFSLAFLLGVFLSSFYSINYPKSCLILLVGILLFFAAALFNLTMGNYLPAVVCFSLISFLAALTYFSYFEYKTLPNFPFGQELLLKGKIVAKPQTDYKNQTVIVQIETLGQKPARGDRLQIVLPHYPAVYYGDTLELKAKIEPPQISATFDQAKYLKRYLVFGVINHPADIVAYSAQLSLREKIYKELFQISDRFDYALGQILPEPEASLSAGVILGLKKNIPDDFTESLKITGLTHIIAMSGYNITIIVTVLSTILLGFINRKKVFWLSLLVVIAFVILTGAASSVLRAAIFSMLVIFGRTIGRKADFTNLLLLAALVMILVNPFTLRYDIGFQLSFLAFAGLIYLTPILEKQFHRFSKIPEFLRNSLAETFSAQIAVFPILLVVFGRVSIISPLANLLVVWSVAYAMAFTFLAGLAAIVFSPLGKLLAVLAWPILHYIVWMTNVLAKIPSASLSFGKGLWQIGVLLYLVVFFWSIFHYRKFKLFLP